MDVISISKQIKLLLLYRVSPLVIGTTGESPTLDHKEEIELIQVARSAIGEQKGALPLVVGAGSNDTDDACKYTEDAVTWGADAILSVFPYYNKPSEAGQLDHFGLIAEAAAGKPVIIYNIPGRTGGKGIAPHTLVELASEHPNIVGVKECNCEHMTPEVIGSYPEGFTVWTGEDGQIVEHMMAGAIGVVSVLANADPAGTHEIVKLCAAGKFYEAGIVLETRKKLISLLFAEGNPNGIKGACHLLGIGNNEARLPMKGASKKLLASLRTEMTELGLIQEE
jgi:4-hydroxy-tetrahydrodipicolinate synthase